MLTTIPLLASLAILSSPFANAAPSNSPVLRTDDGLHPSREHFRTADFSPIYDARFATTPLTPSHRSGNFSLLVQAYLRTMTTIGVETWLMHDTLHAWQQTQSLGKDTERIDVQISEAGLRVLAAWHNMTMWRHAVGDEEKARIGHSRAWRTSAFNEDVKSYLLEVHPEWRSGGSEDKKAIDARFVDMDTGLFVDLIALRRGRRQLMTMHTRRGEEFETESIYPLRTGVFEGVPVSVPAKWDRLLLKEFGPKALDKEVEVKPEETQKTLPFIQR